ncbi:hypothetical protein [Winogradskyella ursingii]|uniref:hypothetical protein n=1 Tax=Winogradskyella ursingii TaxID=2686079 RepID=UPI0015CD9A9B|nr:hypothetical protein [Winogradskyella ursingii]
MKTKSIAVFGILFLAFLTLTSSKDIQDKLTFEGVYDGKEDYGYNFIGMDEEGDEFTMTFQNIDAEVLKSFNLNSQDLVGSRFAITYTSVTEIETDEDGYEDEIETNTIVALKKL